MATLISPSVSVTLTDDSSYTSAPTGTVPFVLIATAENKLTPSNTIAPGTTSTTAGELFLVTSQRDLVNTFGAPVFQTAGGSPVNGSELNEYGLMAAYSALGVADAAYVLRADIDLNALTGSVIPPSSPVANGTLWFDTTDTSWGIFVWNAASQTFNSVTTSNPSGSGKLFVITDPAQTSDSHFSTPLASIGKIGDFAVVTTNATNPVWAQTQHGWELVGDQNWKLAVPAITGNIANPTISATGIFDINAIPVTLSSGQNLTGIISTINSTANINVTANSYNGFLTLYSDANITLSGNVATIFSDLGISAGVFSAPQFTASPFNNIPSWNTAVQNTPSGSVWFNTSVQESGANFVVKTFNTTSNSYVLTPVTVAKGDVEVNTILDPIGGGLNIATGTLYMQYGSADLSLSLFTRTAGPTVALPVHTTESFANATTYNFTLNTNPDANANGTVISFTVTSSIPENDFAAAINAANIPNISATVVTDVNNHNLVQITNTVGGVILLTDGLNTPLAIEGFVANSNNPLYLDEFYYSNWLPANYVVSVDPPVADPVNGSLWYFNSLNDFDIMINDGSAWRGYKNLTADARGFNLTLTDPNGPIVSAGQPILGSTGNALVLGDLWIDTSALPELSIYRYQSTGWTLINNTDHTSQNGIIFADARWAPNGNVDPVTSPFPTITSLLTSDYLDADAPSYALYPRGTLLFNSRRSGLNVKKFTTNWLTQKYPLPTVTNAWVSASGNDELGVEYFYSNAQRNMVVEALNSVLTTNADITQEIYAFNLLTCPGYPELMSSLVTLNIDRLETGFIVGDSPLTLAANSTAINNWATNANGATVDSANGLVTSYPQLAVYYPAGLTTDLGGNNIVVPASHMALNTIIQSDNISYPWFAPAGLQRGVVTNVSSVGYLDGNGNFITTSISQALRDVLYPNGVNPITTLAGSGIIIYGDMTRSGATTSMNRINVARLVAYLRGALGKIGANYIFEPNDPITRAQFANALGSFLSGIQTQRGLTDWAVDCSTDLNTPAVIDANQLLAAVAIEPVKSADFIYIPITLMNTGAITSSGITTN